MWRLITELLRPFPSLEHYLCLFSTRHCIYPFILHLALCSQQQPMKSPFVRPFGDIVPRGGQGHHSSLVINAGLSALVDFGSGGLSSWACASSYHPGGPAQAQTNNFSDESRRPPNHTCSQMCWSLCSKRHAVLLSANKLGLSGTGALGKGRNKSLVFHWVWAKRDEILYVWDLMVLEKQNFTKGCYLLVYLHTFPPWHFGTGPEGVK